MTAKLPYRVECKSTHPFYEVIAAFNCAAAARFYAADCEAANPRFAYRVVSSAVAKQPTPAFDRWDTSRPWPAERED
jgi:hypothetical protein